jgi:hypothetical protein
MKEPFLPDPNVPLTLKGRGASVQNLRACLNKLGYPMPKHKLDKKEVSIGMLDTSMEQHHYFN